MDPHALDQICTFWMTVPPRTAFRDVFELPAGHRMRARNGSLQIEQYWEPDFQQDPGMKTADEYAEQLRALLIDATKLQLRADVPVGAYLSGGIDSSAITALAKHHTPASLHTFSLAFTDEGFDESAYQRQMIDASATTPECSEPPFSPGDRAERGVGVGASPVASVKTRRSPPGKNGPPFLALERAAR